MFKNHFICVQLHRTLHRWPATELRVLYSWNCPIYTIFLVFWMPWCDLKTQWSMAVCKQWRTRAPVWGIQQTLKHPLHLAPNLLPPDWKQVCASTPWKITGSIVPMVHIQILWGFKAWEKWLPMYVPCNLYMNQNQWYFLKGKASKGPRNTQPIDSHQ